ncbi:hypothetical protein SAMN05192529_12622 [Arachidicoccus rhizosphaerae]|uniref:Uncharacterized protein n=1 Tax=Arachidicoccus rhizosphaerae TaxID=551991 RepID=A0A1H4C0J6_9BACT|nr:hypothetical protein SAMN05192529_12622 [Arachidicoccus rhizosphaerae]
MLADKTALNAKEMIKSALHFPYLSEYDKALTNGR